MLILRNLQDKMWIFTLIGGILLLISNFAPMIFMNNYYQGFLVESFYYWSTGSTLYNSILSGSHIGIATNPTYVAPGIILLISTLAFGAYTLYLSIQVRTRSNLQRLRSRFISIALLQLIITLGVMIVILYSLYLDMLIAGLSASDLTMGPGFGIIGPLIGTGLILFGVYGYKYYSERSVKDIYKTQPPSKITNLTLMEQNDMLSNSADVRFCSFCGKEVIQKGLSFCSFCGKKLLINQNNQNNSNQ